MSLSSPPTFLCVAGSCTVVDKNAHTIGARQRINKKNTGRKRVKRRDKKWRAEVWKVAISATVSCREGGGGSGWRDGKGRVLAVQLLSSSVLAELWNSALK
jgi:hypothetical protein